MIVCDPETSIVRRPGSELGRCVREKKTSILHIDSQNQWAYYVNIKSLPLLGLN
jgi:hypothetical protein